jgi:hypothetical protein
MRNFGLVALIAIGALATACKKKPSAKIYNTWQMVSVEMPAADSVTLEKMKSSSVEFTFNKTGKYTYNIAGQSGEGTFEINNEATILSTTDKGVTEMQNVLLTESTMELSKGADKMMFKVKK